MFYLRIKNGNTLFREKRCSSRIIRHISWRQPLLVEYHARKVPLKLSFWYEI